MQTLHIYENDEYLKFIRITNYKYKEKKQKYKEKKIEYKRVLWTKEDHKNEYRKQNAYDNSKTNVNITIHESVKEIDENCFKDFHELQQLTIQITVEISPKKCLEKLPKLEELIEATQFELHGKIKYFM